MSLPYSLRITGLLSVSLIVMACLGGCANKDDESTVDPKAAKEDAGGFPDVASRDSAARAVVRGNLAALGTKLDVYAMKNGGSYPESLDALDPVPSPDPYGNPYIYKLAEGSDFELWCLGADGKLGGEGFDSDLSFQMVIDGKK